jgi:hypothetical protein
MSPLSELANPKLLINFVNSEMLNSEGNLIAFYCHRTAQIRQWEPILLATTVYLPGAAGAY